MQSNPNPLVTVVIPTWNRRHLVAEAIASVVGQRFKNWELLVVDDGSTDDTVGALQHYAVPGLRVIQSEHLGHLGRLRNHGARRGQGEFVAFLDSDDLWCEAKLERQVSALQNSRAGWSYTEYALLSESGARMPLTSGRAPAISGRIVSELLTEETAVCPCTLMVRRTLFDAIGGFREDARIPYRGDADLALRLARVSDAIAIPEILSLVREHSGRMTRDIAAPHEHTAGVYELFLHDENDPKLRKLATRAWARCIADAAAERMAAGEFKSAAGLFRQSLEKAGLTIHWLRAPARGARNYLRNRSRGITAPPQRP